MVPKKRGQGPLKEAWRPGTGMGFRRQREGTRAFGVRKGSGEAEQTGFAWADFNYVSRL